MTSKLTYGVLSDTHGSIPSEIYEVFQGAQCIFHCGDIGSSGLIFELEALAPLHLVRGNMDWNLSPIYEESLIASVEFGTVVMAHGTRYGHYNESIIKGLMHQFAHLQPRLMMFGHSHVAFLEQRNGIWLLNPGSPSHPRGGLPTVALIEYDPKTDEIDLHHVVV